MDAYLFFTGLLIFLTRVVDVSLGTIRTIVTVQGRMLSAFLLGLLEVTLWLVVISAVVDRVMAQPILILFYALGFSTGNVVGIWVERKIALGDIILRLIVPDHRKEVHEALRAMDFPFTIFRGEGREGPVLEFYVVCSRRDLNRILSRVLAIDPTIFYLTETPGQVRRMRQAIVNPPTGWRAIAKRK